MKIAVTGASGFIGTELLAVLKNRENTEAIALTRDASRFTDTDWCEWRSTDYSGESLKKALEGADCVIHLAGVRGTENDPQKFAVNEEMTANILEAMMHDGVRRVVFASTMSVYNDDELMPWTEDAPLGGRSSYGDSKVSCEKLIRKTAEESGFTYGIARIAQVVGEGEKRRGMMNVFLDTARENGTIRVMGRSVLKKQYIYVKDLVEVLAVLAGGNERFDASENIVVNVGMQDAYSNLEVAQTVNAVFGNHTPIDYDDSYPEKGRPFHMDISRLRSALGYEPLDMREAVTALRDQTA